MERIANEMDGFASVNSDLCITVYGGKGGWKKLWDAVCENIEEFILGFIEGYTGLDLSTK